MENTGYIESNSSPNTTLVSSKVSPFKESRSEVVNKDGNRHSSNQNVSNTVILPMDSDWDGNFPSATPKTTVEVVYSMFNKYSISVSFSISHRHNLIMIIKIDSEIK